MSIKSDKSKFKQAKQIMNKLCKPFFQFVEKPSYTHFQLLNELLSILTHNLNRLHLIISLLSFRMP